MYQATSCCGPRQKTEGDDSRMRIPMNVDRGRHLNASGDGVAENTIACVQKAHSRLAHARGRVALTHGMAPSDPFIVPPSLRPVLAAIRFAALWRCACLAADEDLSHTLQVFSCHLDLIAFIALPFRIPSETNYSHGLHLNLWGWQDGWWWWRGGWRQRRR